MAYLKYSGVFIETKFISNFGGLLFTIKVIQLINRFLFLLVNLLEKEFNALIINYITNYLFIIIYLGITKYSTKE